MDSSDLKWPRRHDVLVLGAFAGLAGSVVRTILELAAIRFLPSYKSCVRIAAAMILDPRLSMVSAGAFLVGIEVDYLVGIVVGLVAVLILMTWGRDHLLLKGAIGGALTWALFYATLSGFLSGLGPSGTVLEAEISLVIHIVFGTAVVYSAWWLERSGGRRLSRHKP